MSTAIQTPRTIIELLNLSTEYLASKGSPTPRLDAEVLLASVLGLNRVGLYVNFDKPLETSEVTAYRKVIARRGAREPVAYILGEKEFMSYSFHVTPQVLIPRPETELLVETVVRELNGDCEPVILDIGTGSGIIAIMLAILIPTARLVAVDVSTSALTLAAENAQKHQVAERINFCVSDLFSGLTVGDKYNCIVSNPPYISDGEIATLSPEVQREPHQALAGGRDGLAIIRRIITEAAHWLTPNGLLAQEIGANQGAAVHSYALASGFTQVQVLPDYAGNDRVVLLRREGGYIHG